MKRRICEKLDNYPVYGLIGSWNSTWEGLGILAFPTMPTTFVERFALMDVENMLFG